MLKKQPLKIEGPTDTLAKYREADGALQLEDQSSPRRHHRAAARGRYS